MNARATTAATQVASSWPRHRNIQHRAVEMQASMKGRFFMSFFSVFVVVICVAGWDVAVFNGDSEIPASVAGEGGVAVEARAAHRV